MKSKLFLKALLALLVRNTAGSLASGLAGGLALAAAAVLYALLEIACFDSLDSLHGNLLLYDLYDNLTIIRRFCQSQIRN